MPPPEPMLTRDARPSLSLPPPLPLPPARAAASPSQESFYKDCLAAGDVTQLAFYQDVLVGAVACRLEAPQGGAEGKGKLYIMTLGVLPPYRGQGIGRRLLNHTLAEARKQDKASEVYLHVQTNNDDAVNFYKWVPAWKLPPKSPSYEPAPPSLTPHPPSRPRAKRKPPVRLLTMSRAGSTTSRSRRRSRGTTVK